MKHQSYHAANLKSNIAFVGPLVIHFDGKLLPAISGKLEMEDRLVIVVAGNDTEKLLGIPKIQRGTGKNVAEAAIKLLHERTIQNSIVGMSFNTTAANTGHKNGACVQLEKSLGRQLLWLACRHHIHEFICNNVFKALFGATSGPKVLFFCFCKAA